MQMLQARDCMCIVFLALTSVLALDSRAQDDPQQDGSSKIQRLGDSGVEKEYQLDFNAPGQATPEASPPPTAVTRPSSSMMATSGLLDSHRGLWSDPFTEA